MSRSAPPCGQPHIRAFGRRPRTPYPNPTARKTTGALFPVANHARGAGDDGMSVTSMYETGRRVGVLPFSFPKALSLNLFRNHSLLWKMYALVKQLFTDH